MQIAKTECDIQPLQREARVNPRLRTRTRCSILQVLAVETTDHYP